MQTVIEPKTICSDNRWVPEHIFWQRTLILKVYWKANVVYGIHYICTVKGSRLMAQEPKFLRIRYQMCAKQREHDDGVLTNFN